MTATYGQAGVSYGHAGGTYGDWHLAEVTAAPSGAGRTRKRRPRPVVRQLDDDEVLIFVLT